MKKLFHAKIAVIMVLFGIVLSLIKAEAATMPREMTGKVVQEAKKKVNWYGTMIRKSLMCWDFSRDFEKNTPS